MGTKEIFTFKLKRNDTLFRLISYQTQWLFLASWLSYFLLMNTWIKSTSSVRKKMLRPLKNLLKQTNILADTLAQKAHNPSAKHSQWKGLPEADLVPRALTFEDRRRICEDLMGAVSGRARVIREKEMLYCLELHCKILIPIMKYSFF